MRLLLLCAIPNFFIFLTSHAQVDTTFLFDTSTPFGALDLRLSKGSGHIYYLEEGKTFSFRESDGIRTNSFLDMTAWDSSPYGQGNMRQRSDTSDLFVMNYRLLKPQKYDPVFTDGYPLVVVMHGFLERGNCAEGDCYHADAEYSPNANLPPASNDARHQLLNNDYNLVHVGSNYLAAHNVSAGRLPDDPALPASAFPGFVLFPQNLNGWDGGSCEDVIRLVRLLCRAYNIDESRIYLNGISHGGHGAYELMKRAPWMFAAAALFSAADDASVISEKMSGAIAGIPLWIFQGALDAHPTPVRTESYIEAFRNAGAVVRYSLYPNLGHGTWNKALAEPDFFTWMLSKRRTDIHVFGGHATICNSSSGTLLSLPEGFKSYAWSFNGTVVKGENKSVFKATVPGAYRGRFLLTRPASSEYWSDWSESLDLAARTQHPPEIRQIGTLLLPDLNGKREAVLEAVDNHPYYYWQKNNLDIGFGNHGDSLKHVTLVPPLGSGMYSLIVAGYDRCKSPASTAKQIVFNGAAPMTLGEPFNVKAEAITPSEIRVSWFDTTTNESGFEIWRRQLAAGADSLWRMATLTEKDATSYLDMNLSPSSTYHYKIRAVNNRERSDYTPGASDELIVSTAADTEAPSAPRDLSFMQEGVTSLRLTWRPALDNSSIRNYIIFYNEDSVHTTSNDTTYLISDLEVNKVYAFRVSAVDRAGNAGDHSNVIQHNTFFSGLYYTHSTGAWQTLPEVDWSIAEFTGVVENFTLAPKTQEDFYNFMFDGYLSVGKDGVYQFRITSDDGSNLSLNDSLLIENDGVHQVNTVTGPIQILSEGPQRITVKYFDYVQADTLLVEYKGPDTGDEWVKIPDEVLTSSIIASVATSGSEDLYVMVYPNPTTYDNIHVQLHSPLKDPVVVRIFDLAGNELFKDIADFNADLQIRTSDYIEGGMYIISITQGSRILNKKIIIR